MKIIDFPRSELIGLEIKIIKSTNNMILNIKGKIIDETKKTITIQTDTQRIIIIKENCVFEIITRDNNKIEINGKLLYGRPEERIKKKMPKKWDNAW
ncbi:MAG: ribonuclease P protein subunit [DPANN group archaeon]|nr:ribonuclease P protein subunit [DPANN group archaeon]